MEAYESRHGQEAASAAAMIYDRFRKEESLNGEWHYAVDQYDTCIWFGYFRNTDCKVKKEFCEAEKGLHNGTYKK